MKIIPGSSKEFQKIKNLSNLVEKKLSTYEKHQEKKLDKLTCEELQDLNEILHLADYILCKHENKKELHSLMKDFVQIIDNSANSIDIINDDIDEMVLSAEGAIKRIKDLQNNVSENYSFSHSNNSPSKALEPKNGSNNLTNSSTPIYTQGYQPESKVENEQVI